MWSGVSALRAGVQIGIEESLFVQPGLYAGDPPLQ